MTDPAARVGPAPAAQGLSASGAPKRALDVHWLGRMRYAQALKLQEQLHSEVASGTRPDTLLLLEHDPVITMGRQVAGAHVLIDEAERKRRGIDYEETGRGGDVTYHGPGQLVGYPIVALQPGERDIKRYVTALEELLIRVAQDFGITAERVEGLRGIWVGNDKLAAIGIRFVRWTTLHGFALNVSTRLADFSAIVPCGLHDRGVTSMVRLGAGAPTLEQVAERVVAHAGDTLARTTRQQQVPLPGLTND